jgi:hypothetical protein
MTRTSNGDSEGWTEADTRPAFTRRDWLIVFFLVIASIQCVRGYYYVNVSTLDWSTYAHGTAELPYQGRVGMIDVLRWAENSPYMIRGAAKLGRMLLRPYLEPMSVEKFTSLLAAIFSMLLIQAYIIHYGWRHRYRLWWLPDVLLLAISFIELSVRSESAMWTPYDLPHALLFGIAILCALDRQWYFVLPLFALDVPWRETSIFLIAICVPLFYVSEAVAWRQSKTRTIQTILLTAAMGIYWAAVRATIYAHYRQNGTDAYVHSTYNVHALLLPNHWTQLLGAGGYLLIFILLEWRRATARQQIILWGFLICAPVILLYGQWTELRIWIEWTVPLAAIAATELQNYFYDCYGGTKTSTAITTA